MIKAKPRKRRKIEHVHTLSLFAALVVIGFGAWLGFRSEPSIAAGEKSPCPFSCQKSHTTGPNATKCEPPFQKEQVQKAHETYQKLKKLIETEEQPDPKAVALAKAIKEKIKECAENLNHCHEKGATFAGGGEPKNTCDKSLDKDKPPEPPKEQQKPPGEQKPKGEGDEKGKPPPGGGAPELPKPPGGGGDKPQQQPQSCPPEKSPEECAQDQKNRNPFSEIFNKAMDTLGFGNETPPAQTPDPIKDAEQLLNELREADPSLFEQDPGTVTALPGEGTTVKPFTGDVSEMYQQYLKNHAKQNANAAPAFQTAPIPASTFAQLAPEAQQGVLKATNPDNQGYGTWNAIKNWFYKWFTW